ncbi:MAG: hydroxymethylglutaryl-CoA synthase family protein [Deltaproteobacteria bacterium]|nr:hydroxymethylglutaryl-CoA synthase family protein [Deltaproteobacteria bacterium]
MDVGISRVNRYVPWLTLPHAVWARAWGERAKEGVTSRAVANFDEDALTMAVDAASPIADGARAIFLASTSAPLIEGSPAARVAGALGLDEVHTVDFGGSQRAAGDAAILAVDAVRAGRGPIVVVASDTRIAEPGSRFEPTWNDGALAFRVEANAGIAARVVAMASVSDPVAVAWRADGERFVTSDESRAGSDALKSATQAALKLAGVGSVKTIGWTELPAWLARAERGETVAAVATGDGATVVVLESVKPLPLSALRSPKPLTDYNDYARRRGLIGTALVGPVVSSVLERQEAASLISLAGGRCRSCGQTQYPRSVRCVKCHALATQDAARVAREGRVFTYTVDSLFDGWEKETVMAVVDLDDGARVYVQITDVTPSEVAVGLRVRLTYRRLHHADGKPLYYWKARPE